MIHDFNRWSSGFVDWNLLLDETGGPNHVGNLCSAPIIADTRNDALLFQNSYYYIGHFARFVRPGAHRVLCASTVSRVEATAFRNTDSSLVIIAMNRTEERQSLHLRAPSWSARTDLAPRSIATYLVANSRIA